MALEKPAWQQKFPGNSLFFETGYQLAPASFQQRKELTRRLQQDG
jgi:hypothetical protein